MFAVILENNWEGRDEKHVLSLHEHDGMPAYKKIYGDDIEALKAEVPVTWREPVEEDDASGDVLWIGE